MSTETNDFGVMEFTYAEKTVQLNYLVFMGKFYAIVPKVSKLASYFRTHAQDSAFVHVLTPESAQRKDNVSVEIMEDSSKVQHVYEHFCDFKLNYFAEYDDSLCVIKCSLL
ncbi:MAG: hypothetical protein AAF975_01615 [Spirochaetota bacterium]